MSDSEPRQKELFQALLSEDELGALVRSHIFIEGELIKFCEARLSKPEQLDKLRLGYRQIVDLALCLGLWERWGPPLKKFGSIRNQFAHKPICE
jgi:hypothetical protein